MKSITIQEPNFQEPIFFVLSLSVVSFSSFKIPSYSSYSLINYLILSSASINSNSSIPSPIYHYRKAFLLNIAVYYSNILSYIPLIEVVFAVINDAIFNPLGFYLQIV